MVPTSIEEAYRKFDDLSAKYIDKLRKITKSIQDSKIARDNESIKQHLKTYDEELDRYIPVLMAQARIYWERENYPMVEKIFFQSADFCNEHDVWKLNVAHVFFMQETKFKESIRYYDPIVKRLQDSLIDITAIILANLCVSYIMTSQNEEAEELMRRIEKEEERLNFTDPDKQFFHLCIINLVICTLYCAKGNFEFGISRIIKSLEPYDKKIHTDTWYYAKRCFLALAEILSKNMLILKDSSIEEIIAFFEKAEHAGMLSSLFIVVYICTPYHAAVPNPILTLCTGAKIPASIDGNPNVAVDGNDDSVQTVAYEARQLKKLYLELYERN